MKLLIIDDEPGYIELLKSLFEELGHTVEVASGSEAAIERGAQFEPELLIVDWKLRDGFSGLDVIRALREPLPDLAAIIITGFSAAELQTQAEELRVASILEKPFTAEAVIEAAEKAIASR